MVYPFLTLDNQTEFVCSEMGADDRVHVGVELEWQPFSGHCPEKGCHSTCPWPY